MLKMTVYLCINVPLERAPEKYKQVVEKCELEPAIFCLPWPDTAIPPIGAKITMRDMPFNFDEFVVNSHEYVVFSAEKAYVEVNLESIDDPNASGHSPEVYLESAAETGFLVFGSWRPIKDLLQEAGLLAPKE